MVLGLACILVSILSVHGTGATVEQSARHASSEQCAATRGPRQVAQHRLPVKDSALLQRRAHKAMPQDRRAHEQGAESKVTIVSYNLYWWNVQANNQWGALYDRIRKQQPFDLIGFQECEDVARVVEGSGLNGFEFYQGPSKPDNNPAPIAWNTKVYEKLEGPGERWVANDRYGGRYMIWVRLLHKASGTSIFFANTHGPLGNCGSTLGNNWVAGIRENKQANDIVFVTGDYNCGTGTSAMTLLKEALDDDGVNDVDAGIDQILTDVGLRKSGGKLEGWPSDHPLVKGTFRVGR